MANGSIGMSGRNFDAFVSSQRSYNNDTDWAVKLREKYWRARQKFLAKVEQNEDSCIILSDSKLDAKLDIYRSIGRSCSQLTSILENYQNALFVFANEENALGILLKECGKHDRTKAGKIMSISGKSLTQSSHQRMKLYMPLMRLYQEMETFHSRAVEDTSETVDKLETRRSQYRASLLWMKDISEKLNPDVYKQLDEFRRVQAKVRDDKKVFDNIQMDVVQKIDLLMASRCNLMNQILAPYQMVLLKTFEKNYNNFKTVEELIKQEDIYDYEFKTLKHLNPLRLSSENINDDKSQVQNDDDDDKNIKEEQLKEVDLLIDEELELPSGGQNNNNNNRELKAKSNVELISNEFAKIPKEQLLVDLISAHQSKPSTSKDFYVNQIDNNAANLLIESTIEQQPHQSDKLDINETTNKKPDNSIDDWLSNEFDNKYSNINNSRRPGDCSNLLEETNKLVSESKLTRLTLDDWLQSELNDNSTNVVDNQVDNLDLMGEFHGQHTNKQPDTGSTNGKQSTIDDLLLNELDDIDNNSYFKSLQGLQI